MQCCQQRIYKGDDDIKDYFDRLNDLFVLFSSSEELLALLDVDVGDDDAADTKIRRSFSDVTTINTDSLNFIDMSFIESNGKTANYLLNRETIEVNIYTKNFYEAGNIFKIIHGILSKNFEDAQFINAAQRSLPVSGVYCFSLRFKTFVSS